MQSAAGALLATLAQRDLVVALNGTNLLVKGPREAMTPEVAQAIRTNKVGLMALLTPEGWPPESLDAERRFGGWHARLYPFIGQTVSTPRGGAGRLVQVLPERATVVLPGEAQVGVFLPEQIRPLPNSTDGLSEVGLVS